MHYNSNQKLSISIRMYGLYGQMESELNVFDPTQFGIPFFKDAFKSAIDTVISISPDETVRDMKKQLFNAETDARKTCQVAYIDVKYYVEKAFKNDPLVVKEFGISQNAKAKNNSETMLVFIETFHTKAVKYEAELTAVGCPASLITGLAAVRDALFDAYDANRSFSVERSDTTTSREAAYATMWDFTMAVNHAGKTLYARNPVKKAQFVLPKPTHNAVHPVKPLATAARFRGKLTATTTGSLENVGKVPLVLYAAKEVLKNLPQHALEVPAGESVSFTAADLSDDGVFDTLFIFNPDAEAVGKYECSK